MAAFTARLRRTIDLDTVQGDLIRVVHEAFQPAHVSRCGCPAPNGMPPSQLPPGAGQPDRGGEAFQP